MSIVEKKEGNTMTCSCDTKLVCHSKTYPPYTDKYGKEHPAKTVPQWQNSDSSPHYKFAGKDEKGKSKFKCIIPEQTAETQGVHIPPTPLPETHSPMAGPITTLSLEKLDAKLRYLTKVCLSIHEVLSNKKLDGMPEDLGEVES